MMQIMNVFRRSGFHIFSTNSVNHAISISGNGSYIAGHLAFIFKLNCKQGDYMYVLKIGLIIICVFHYINTKHHLSTIKTTF